MLPDWTTAAVSADEAVAGLASGMNIFVHGAAATPYVPFEVPFVVSGGLSGLALLVFSPRFRAWSRSRDLRLLTELQAWRMIGFAFLAVAAVDALPAGFAVPAGVGDVLVGLTAPIVATLVVRTADAR